MRPLVLSSLYVVSFFISLLFLQFFIFFSNEKGHVRVCVCVRVCGYVGMCVYASSPILNENDGGGMCVFCAYIYAWKIIIIMCMCVRVYVCGLLVCVFKIMLLSKIYRTHFPTSMLRLDRVKMMRQGCFAMAQPTQACTLRNLPPLFETILYFLLLYSSRSRTASVMPSHRTMIPFQMLGSRTLLSDGMIGGVAVAAESEVASCCVCASPAR